MRSLLNEPIDNISMVLHGVVFKCNISDRMGPNNFYKHKYM